MPKPFTTPELREHLATRVLGPDGQGGRAFLFEEVTIGGRRADAISIGTWQSRGRLIEGYELKTNRRDWQNEMRQHEKAEPTLTICDRFWLVTNPGVLLPGELPEPWGLLLADGRGRPLKVEKPAPKLRERNVAAPVNREALVRLLRCAEEIGTAGVDEVYERTRREAAESVDFDRKRAEREIDVAQGHVRDYEAGWDAFHQALGLERWKWRPTEEDLAFIGKVAAALRNGEEGLQQLHDQLRRIESTAGDLAGKTNDAMTVVNDHIYGKGQAA